MTDLTTLSAAVSPPAPPALARVAPPRLWQGDDQAGYDILHERLSEALGPQDFLEEVWARDAVDLIWEVFRLRRLKAELMREAAYNGLNKVLDPRRSLLGQYNPYEVARYWASRDPEAIALVDKALATSGLTMDAVLAKTLALHLDEFERIERMTAEAEGRRDSILREIGSHRASFAQRLRHAVEDVEDAEFKVIAPDGVTPESPAPAGAAQESPT